MSARMAALVLTMLVGCRAPRPPVTVAPDASWATVLFVETVHRVSMSPALGIGGVRNAATTVVDESGRMLGRLGTNSWFAARVAPGEHLFVAIEGPKRPVHAWVAAGRVYVVEVKLGPSRGMALEPVTPRDGRWSRVPSWLASFQGYPAAQEGFATAAGVDAVMRAREHLGSLSPEAVERHLLRPEDGSDVPLHSAR